MLTPRNLTLNLPALAPLPCPASEEGPSLFPPLACEHSLASPIEDEEEDEDELEEDEDHLDDEEEDEEEDDFDDEEDGEDEKIIDESDEDEEEEDDEEDEDEDDPDSATFFLQPSHSIPSNRYFQ